MIERTLRENLATVAALAKRPRSALEVGALPDERSVLAHLPDITERVGINLTEEGHHGGLTVTRGDACAIDWPDDHFDLVVCASTLEHIPQFWKATDEMKRVLAPGGALLLSTPGFGQFRGERAAHGIAGRLRLPDVLVRGTITMRVHDTVDYYRFSEDAYRDVLMTGLVDVTIWRIMVPPRIFATGTKPHHGGT